MEIIPVEYFLGNNFELEPGRFQSFKNCWANSLASLIGDTFCLQNNLQPVIPSVIWITSMRKDACNYYKLQNCEKLSLQSGFNTELMAKYMMENQDKYFVKLEKCFPELDTVQMISDDLGIGYNSDSEEEDDRLYQVKLEYLGNVYSNCCIKEEIIDGKRKPLNCLIPNNEKEELEMTFNLKIENFYKIEYDFSNKENYTAEKIKNLQNIIKTIIYCKRKPILTSILITEDRSQNLRNLKLNNFIIN